MDTRVLVSQLCQTFCSPVHGISQARILEWVPIPFSGDLPDSGIKPRSPALQADSLPFEPPGKPSHLILLSSLLLGFCGFCLLVGFSFWCLLAFLSFPVLVPNSSTALVSMNFCLSWSWILWESSISLLFPESGLKKWQTQLPSLPHSSILLPFSKKILRQTKVSKLQKRLKKKRQPIHLHQVLMTESTWRGYWPRLDVARVFLTVDNWSSFAPSLWILLQEPRTPSSWFTEAVSIFCLLLCWTHFAFSKLLPWSEGLLLWCSC